MGTITTKYSVGDKLYIVTSRGLETTFDVTLGVITSINIGGKYWEKYQFNSTTRGENEIYTDLAEAKKAAKAKAKEHYDRNIAHIDDTKLDDVHIQGEEK